MDRKVKKKERKGKQEMEWKRNRESKNSNKEGK
jgi:hypothetical protein